jgi:hypothetical protein
LHEPDREHQDRPNRRVCLIHVMLHDKLSGT